MIERIHQLVKRSNTAPKSVIELLNNTLIGTEGSLYQLLDTETKIHDLVDPNFIYLERNEKAIGNVTICERLVKLNGEEEQSLYIRYFAFEKIFQGGSSIGKSNSAFHEYFKHLFCSSNMDPVNPEKNKSVYWAFIDPQNLRSFNMNKKFGFQSVGTFRTKAFSRVSPKLIKGVEQIADKEKESVLQDIKAFYNDFNFFSAVHLFDHNNYFVYKFNGEVVAGIQANPVRFKIKSLPGISGKFLIRALPFIPRLNKLINPHEHKFLATEGIFWKDGHQDKVQRLLEGVLYKTKQHSLLLWYDDSNQMLEKLDIKWGSIQRLKKDNPIHIVAKFNGYDQEEIKSISTSKKYLSGFDMS
jgi:hypothetical protein